MRHTLHIEQDGDHVHVHLGNLPEPLRLAVAAALADEVGFLDLAKAGAGPPGHEHGEGLDPRFPELVALIEQFRGIWSRWMQWLVEGMLAALQRGPPSPARAAAIQKLFEEHSAGVTAMTTGAAPDPRTTAELVLRKQIPPGYEHLAPIPTAVRAGLGRDPVVPPKLPTHVVEPPPPRPLTHSEQAAVAYASERAGIFMRRPIASLHASMAQVALGTGTVDRRKLSPEESALIRSNVARGIRENVSPGELARRLRAAASSTSLTNDMDRVARTELHEAHSQGAMATLIARHPPGADPLVYRIVNAGACSECRRIFGHPSNPKHYRLSVVTAGSNFGLPRAQWGPVIGPVHPNCTCPPWLEWNPEVHSAVADVAALMREEDERSLRGGARG